MKSLVFLRHGESDWNAQGRYQGQTDVPLSETGRAQAYEAARRWGHTEFDSVIVSPLTRTKDTGRIMLLDRQLEPRSEEHTSELQSRGHLVCRLLLEKKKEREQKINTKRITAAKDKKKEQEEQA